MTTSDLPGWPAAMSYQLAGDYIGLSGRTVRKHVHDGVIASIALGSRRVVERAELDRYLAAERARQQPRRRTSQR